MAKIQVQLTDEQTIKLKRVAARTGVSVSEIIRRSIDIFVASEDITDRDEVRARARSAFGAFQDKETDVSENHDQYFSGEYQE